MKYKIFQDSEFSLIIERKLFSLSVAIKNMVHIHCKANSTSILFFFFFLNMELVSQPLILDSLIQEICMFGDGCTR